MKRRDLLRHLRTGAGLFGVERAAGSFRKSALRSQRISAGHSSQ